MSASKCIVHNLPPSIDGAYSDMSELINSGEELAACYFADNDLIALGASKRLKKMEFVYPKIFQ